MTEGEQNRADLEPSSKSAWDLILAAPDARDLLNDELTADISSDGPPIREFVPGLFGRPTGERTCPRLVFSRQIAPKAREVRAASIQAWARLLVDAVAGVLPDGRPWSLHVFPFTPATETRLGARAWHTRSRTKEHRGRVEAPSNGGEAAGGGGHRVPSARCLFIRDATIELLARRRRHLLRSLRQDPAPFSEEEALVQLILISPEEGFLSLSAAPTPFTERQNISFFPGGVVPLAVDKAAPSRAFTKLVEAEARLGQRIAAGDSCVDLGASPGSWTYVATERGARVTAVDRSELRADLMRHRNVRFVRGDAFRFVPEARVDWLLCDVIARAERSAELLTEWLREGRCRHFIVTLKMEDSESGSVLSNLKRELPTWTEALWILKLCANKKEVCAFGTARDPRTAT